MRRLFGLVAVITLALAGCSPASGGTPKVSVESPWVRTTVGAKDASMTAAFLTLVNPGDTEVKLVAASTPAAGMVQLHEMVKDGDKSVMREAPGGIAVPAGGHQHLTPGGYHIMLMHVSQELKVGDQVALELTFSDGSKLSVSAPVKEFVEEEDHYHPSASPSPSA